MASHEWLFPKGYNIPSQSGNFHAIGMQMLFSTLNTKLPVVQKIILTYDAAGSLGV